MGPRVKVGIWPSPSTSTFGHEVSSLPCTPIEKPSVSKGKKPKLSAGVTPSLNTREMFCIEVIEGLEGKWLYVPLALRVCLPSSCNYFMLGCAVFLLPVFNKQAKRLHGLNAKATRISPHPWMGGGRKGLTRGASFFTNWKLGRSLWGSVR